MVAHSPEYVDRVILRARRTGEDVIALPTGVRMAQKMITGLMVFLPIWLAERFARPSIAYRPVEGLEPATLTVAWPERSRSAAVGAFVQTLQRIARDTAPYENPAD